MISHSFLKIHRHVCPSLVPNLLLPYANVELVIQDGKMCDYQVQGPQLDGLPTPQWPQWDFGRQDGSQQNPPDCLLSHLPQELS